NCFFLCFKSIAYIKNNIRLKRAVLHIMENMRRAPTLLGLVLFILGFNLGESAVKNSIQSQLSGLTMVWMTIGWRTYQADMGTVFAYLLNDCYLIFACIFNLGIGEA